MRILSTKWHRGILTALLIAALVSAAPLVSHAQPGASASTNAAIEARRAEEQAARVALENSRIALEQQIDEYLRVGQRLETARLEITDVEAQIAVADAELAEKQDALVARAIELYQGEWESTITLLFQAESLADLFARYKYLSIINERDANLLRDMRIARVESEWLHHTLSDREARLVELQEEADLARERIEKDIADQEARAEALGADLAQLMRQAAAEAAAAQAVSGAVVSPDGFSPDMIITDANFRASRSMNAAQIQQFLERQTGILAGYRAPNHAGVMMSSAEMIEEAALAWNVSPKVILATLQKEQSLLSRRNPDQRALDWAMGCGKMDSRTLPQFQGFGRQIWHGARVLDRNTAGFTPDGELRISGSVVRPANAATHTLYRYTPHMRGNVSFWMIYWRHFGNPLAGS